MSHVSSDKIKNLWCNCIYTVIVVISAYVVTIITYWEDMWCLFPSLRVKNWLALIVACAMPCALVLFSWEKGRLFRDYGILLSILYLILVWDTASFFIHSWYIAAEGRGLSISNLWAGLWLVSLAACVAILMTYLTHDTKSVRILRITWGICGIPLAFGLANLILACKLSVGMRRILGVFLIILVMVALMCLIQGIMLMPFFVSGLERLCERIWGMHLQREQFGDDEVSAGMNFGGLRSDHAYPNTSDYNLGLDKWGSAARREVRQYVEQRKPRVFMRLTSDALGVGLLFLVAHEIASIDPDWITKIAPEGGDWISMGVCWGQRIAEFLQISGIELVVSSFLLFLVCVVAYNIYRFYIDCLVRIDRYFRNRSSK